MERKVFLYEPKHRGSNIILVSKVDYDIISKTVDIQTQRLWVEITTQNSNEKVYGLAWYEPDNVEQTMKSYQEGISIGLEKTLMDTCLLQEGDAVHLKGLYSKEIQPAISAELEILGDSQSKIQTTQDLQMIRNRILGGEILLGKNIRFTIPFRTAGITTHLLFRVLNVEPPSVPVYCNDETTLLFKGLSVKDEDTSLNFSSIGGLKKQIDLLREMVQLPMEHPDVFLQIGLAPPRGVLLYGPPGNGKTLLARTLAQEIKAQFYTINGPELTSKFVGEGERKLREVFEKARTNTPSIIFFDEIDSVAGKRDSFASEFEVKMVGQLLSLMDGLDDRGNVIVVAATNRHNSLDPALRRPGRFDREIEIGLPSEQDRLEILRVHVKKMTLSEDVTLDEWAVKTSGYTGADLAALVKEAAMCCFRRIFALSKNGSYVKTDDIVLKKEDFILAFKELLPTNLRELPAQAEPVAWNEILWMKELKEQLLSLIEPTLNQPTQLQAFGLSAPSGILLAGTPNSGKKTILLSLAHHLDIPCFVVRTLDFVTQTSQKQEQTLTELFRKARLSSPSIILLDKVDSAFSMQLKYNMESFLFAEELIDEIKRNRLYENVFVVGTARTTENLPSTLLSSSVFGHVLHIPMLSLEERQEIVRQYLEKHFDVDCKELAKIVEGLHIGEITHLCENCLRRFIEFEFKTVSSSSIEEYFTQVSLLMKKHKEA